MAAIAVATTHVVDEKRETTALARHGRVDIISATASRGPNELDHTVTMRRRVMTDKPRERPFIVINSRGGGRSDAEYLLFQGKVYDVRKPDPRKIGSFEFSSEGRIWSFRFSKSVIPELTEAGHYGWAALTDSGTAADAAPSSRYAVADAR